MLMGAAFLCALSIGRGLTAEAIGHQAIDFRSGWRFSKADHEGAELREFNDSAWAEVRLPHDWAIAGPFDPQLDGSTGKLPWRGVGWYRKKFKLNANTDDRVYLDFDGVMAFPQIYVNGKLAGQWDYGYTSFRIDATPYIKPRGENVVAVRVDTRRHRSRWYPGAGIYRKVTLQIRRPIHVAQWGVFVTTPEVSHHKATVHVEASIENHDEAPASVQVEFALQDPSGSAAAGAAAKQQITLQPGTANLEQPLRLERPRLWDIANPQLYTLRTIVRRNGKVLDEEQTSFGIRTFAFTADDGFHLNGRRVQLYGVNLHHDHGPLGAAFYTRAMERQLEIMRDVGVNAIRTSHNAPATELLDLCDRLGFLVWDECFDKWDDTAGRLDGTPSHEEHARRHLGSMVRRDRNHPCVVVWSIGNEIPADREGVTPGRVQMMRDVVLSLDSTRPVGLGCHEPPHVDKNLVSALDLTGWNYARRYARYRERYPDKPVVYSESASALSTRGFYELPLPKTKTDYSHEHQVSSYDLNAAPWSDIVDAEFKLMQDDRFVAGEFVWTGFDYLGEPTPFEKQAKSSYFGIVDLCGIPKDRYYLYRSHWRPETTTIHILPHWNWPDRAGQTVPVFLYTNGDSAELFLNGKSLGVREKGVMPKRPANLASGRPAFASSSNPSHAPQEATDDSVDTRWCAATDAAGQWWQVNLGEAQPLKCFMIEFDKEAKHYGYEIQASIDGTNWETVHMQQPSGEPRWGGPRTAIHEVDVRARLIRIDFTTVPRGQAASLCEFGVYSAPAESPYYVPTYAYRLRWDDVVYEPGELRAVAYKDGEEIGSAVVRTAGEPAALRLTADRTELVSTGDDLCYVLVKAVDEHGTACPLADNLVRFSIDGPGEIAAVGNGNPLSIEPFQAHERRLFYGKAMLIVRTLEAQPAQIRITARSKGLAEAHASCRVAPQFAGVAD
jgi:beta-galactosidase